jgi:hypothetical protein
MTTEGAVARAGALCAVSMPSFICIDSSRKYGTQTTSLIFCQLCFLLMQCYGFLPIDAIFNAFHVISPLAG